MVVNSGQILAENLGKSYRLYDRGIDRLREWVGGRRHHRTHWALQDVNLSVEAGEAIGVVGPNGAGKSTLLKLIAGVISPTSGSLVVGGRVCALLELGLGFDPELTGRDNLRVAGQLLGMQEIEIAERVPWIIDFSEMSDAIDDPVRTYSSGMQMRLAFALAVAKRPDILIVDEALSVGDLFFQQKCYGLIQEYHSMGTTLFFVTHSMGAVQHLCDRAVLLDHGQMILDGEPQAVMNLYESRGLVAKSTNLSAQDFHINTEATQAAQQGSLQSKKIHLDKIQWMQGEQVVQAVYSESVATLDIVFHSQAILEDVHVGIKVRDKYGLVIYETNTYCQGHFPGDLQNGDTLKLEFTMPMNIREGLYNVTLGLATGGFGEGNFCEQLWYAHGLAPIEIMRRTDIGLWDGITNLRPQIVVCANKNHESSSSL